MHRTRSSAAPLLGRYSQFSLAQLFECVTACSIPLAFANVIGFECAAVLVAMTVAVAARRGMAALLLLFVAAIASEARAEPLDSTVSIGRQVLVGAWAAVLCNWYAMRRRLADLCDPRPRHPATARPPVG